MTEPSASFLFDDPDFFVAGALGDPGQRVFYMQSGQGDESFALRCEKQHVAILATHLEELLADLPPSAPDPMSRELRQPVVTDWLLGGLAFGFDTEAGRIVIIAEELLPEDATAEPAHARVAITGAQAMSFMATTEELLSGGRPACRICGLPMNLGGHVCPRTNGHSAG